jgi:hypothetical protein
MDIGQTIRSFTVEPLRNPVPPRRTESESTLELEKELDPKLTPPPADVPFVSPTAPSLIRRLG